MGLKGKLIGAVEYRAGGDVFHQLFRHKPHQISDISPQKMQGCDLVEGEFGQVGSIIYWTYTQEGKEMFAKHVIQAIDEEKQLIQYKLLEGSQMEEYKDFISTIHIEKKDDIDLVTLTLEYETLNDDVGPPISLLSYFIDLTKDIETHHLGKP